MLIAETYRELLDPSPQELGPLTRPSLSDVVSAVSRDYNGSFLPIEPTLEATSPILPPQPNPTRFVEPSADAEWRAGAQITRLLSRAQTYNLSGVRVLNAAGCVIATSRGELGACFDNLPEVQRALTGHYNAVVRERISDEPAPDVRSIRRSGHVRVFTALPIIIKDQVVGVVRMSRSTQGALQNLWANRLVLVAGFGTVLLVLFLGSLGLSLFIGRPVRHITRFANAIATGNKEPAFKAITGFVPREVHDLDRSLRTMTQRLAERSAYIEELASNISHELKTPITSIRGAIELLRDNDSAMPELQRQRFLQTIDLAGQRLQLLVSRLLDLARIENAPGAKETIEVVPFLEEVVAPHGQRIELQTRLAPKWWTGQKDHFRSAINNLLDNALRYGGNKPVIVRLENRNDRLVIEVEDFGPGISKANQTRVFERFFTTERENGGTGLGLSIVKAIAEAHGGHVRFVSSSQGTTFILTI